MPYFLPPKLPTLRGLAQVPKPTTVGTNQAPSRFQMLAQYHAKAPPIQKPPSSTPNPNPIQRPPGAIFPPAPTTPPASTGTVTTGATAPQPTEVVNQAAQGYMFSPFLLPGTTNKRAGRPWALATGNPNYQITPAQQAAIASVNLHSEDPQLTSKMQELWDHLPNEWRAYMVGWDPQFLNAYLQRYAMGDLAAADQIKQDWESYVNQRNANEAAQKQQQAQAANYRPARLFPGVK